MPCLITRKARTQFCVRSKTGFKFRASKKICVGCRNWRDAKRGPRDGKYITDSKYFHCTDFGYVESKGWGCKYPTKSEGDNK